MTREEYRDEIRLKLTGDILELELTDSTLDSIINSAMREVQRYICSNKLITVPFSTCIDISALKDENGNPLKVSSITNIYRAEGVLTTDSQTGASMIDPMQAAQWQLVGGLGTLNNFQGYMYNLDSWLSLLQIKNTLSTDLAHRYDKASNKLYINISSGTPSAITIEYIPKFDDPEEIVSDFWTDVLMRMSLAIAKITVGRVRSRYTQSNALWTQDGQTILQEGLQEYQALQEYLQANTQLVYGID